MLDTILTFLFWTACALVLYSYVVYPLAMTTMLRPRPAGGADKDDRRTLGGAPTVEVVVAAYNEQSHIRGRVANLLDQDYDDARLAIAIGSDGSTDQTAAEGMAVQGPRVRFHAFKENRGKASVLNDLVRESRAEIIVFTDANTVFAPDAVKRLAAHFEDPAVGAACGELLLQSRNPGTNRDHEYWSLERRLKLGESQVGGLLGANGGIYAIRREFYRPLAADTICDDFVIGMDIATRGARLVYDPLALAYEDTPDDLTAEYRRRVRIGTGNYQAFFRRPRYIFGAAPVRVFTYLSHKVLRWFTPHLLLVALVASALLADRAFFAAVFALQLLGYAVLAVAYASRRRVQLPTPLAGLLFVAVLNVAFLVGFFRYLSGNYRGSWHRSER